jgi:hypothetical protein
VTWKKLESNGRCNPPRNLHPATKRWLLEAKAKV